jgi:hypothetical protein
MTPKVTSRDRVLGGIWIAASEPVGRSMNDRIGVLIAVLSSTFGGTAAAVTRYIVGSLDPVTIAAFRFGIGVMVLLPLVLLCACGTAARDLAGVSLLGVMFFAVFFVFYNIAMGYTTAARGSLALSTLPLWTMVVARCSGPSRSPRARRSACYRGRGCRDRARGGLGRRSGRRVARRFHHDRRDAVHGVLQCLVPAVHCTLVAARFRHRLDGGRCGVPCAGRVGKRRLHGDARVRSAAMGLR